MFAIAKDLIPGGVNSPVRAFRNVGGEPFFVRRAAGSRIEDIDGKHYIDYIGSWGPNILGHAPVAITNTIHEVAKSGISFGIPNLFEVEMARAICGWVPSVEKVRMCSSGTEATMSAIRLARGFTKRDYIVKFNGCYHGTVDDVFVDLVEGRPVQRASLLGQVQDLTTTTRVVEFNDLAALEAALAPGDVACVLAEPVMTNIGMVLPDPGYWAQASALIRRHGSLLVMDETHTLSSGPGGYARAHGVKADAVVVGKAIGGGMPCAAYGFSAELAERAEAAKRAATPGHSGIGTTLTANLLAMAAMRATLSTFLRPEIFAPMHARAERLAAGLRGLIERHRLPWCVSQVGARTEFQFCARPPRNGSEAGAAMDPELEHALHLYLLNRGVLITPFHNMMLVCPDTTDAHVGQLLGALETAIEELIGG